MTNYQVKYAAGVVRDLNGLPKQVRNRAMDAVETILVSDPYRGRPLTGAFKGLFRFRIGDYRIIYKIEKDWLVVFVLRIRHRKDVYRGLL